MIHCSQTCAVPILTLCFYICIVPAHQRLTIWLHSHIQCNGNLWQLKFTSTFWLIYVCCVALQSVDVVTLLLCFDCNLCMVMRNYIWCWSVFKVCAWRFIGGHCSWMLDIRIYVIFDIAILPLVTWYISINRYMVVSFGTLNG